MDWDWLLALLPLSREASRPASWALVTQMGEGSLGPSLTHRLVGGRDGVAGEGLGEACDGGLKGLHVGVEGLDGGDDGGDEADVIEAERAVRRERRGACR